VQKIDKQNAQNSHKNSLTWWPSLG